MTIEVTPATGNLEPNTYQLNIRRQPVPRLEFAPSGLSLDEGGTATYTVDLDTRWLGQEVTVAIASDHPAVTVSPDTVSYTPTDWSPHPVVPTDYTRRRRAAAGGRFVVRQRIAALPATPGE